MGFVLQGHRGARARWPENTLAGFAAALAAGADALELDAGLTADGVVVVCHDPALNPDLTRGPDGAWITAGPLLHDLTLADLRRYDVGRPRPGGRVAKLFPAQTPVDGARVPTLAEVFDLARDSRAQIDVELKTDPRTPHLTPHPAGLADAVWSVARSCHMAHRLALRSFDWRGLDHAAGWGVPRSFLTEPETEAAPALWWGAAGVVSEALAGRLAPGDSWAPLAASLTPARIAAAHALGLAVVPWTVNDPAELARLVAWGVDGLCTDDPAWARDLLSKLRPAVP